jgi:hypothetical protein
LWAYDQVVHVVVAAFAAAAAAAVVVAAVLVVEVPQLDLVGLAYVVAAVLFFPAQVDPQATMVAPWTWLASLSVCPYEQDTAEVEHGFVPVGRY